MELKILKIIAICCIINVQNLFACGWGESAETYRLALFRAEVSKMSVFRPFYYSASLYNNTDPDPQGFDKAINCAEWQKKIGLDVSVSDIDIILYQTNPELLELARQNQSLAETFSGNTFIQKLLLKKNIDLLEYLIFAKKIEYTNSESSWKWEAWDNPKPWRNYSEYVFKGKATIDYKDFQSLTQIKDEFLQKRYAFLMLRFNCQTHLYDEALKIYNRFFENKSSNSIIDSWALLFKALALDNKGETLKANYLYSLVFDQTDEKKFIALQCFNATPTMLEQTLLLAKSPYEKAVIKAMALFRNPGPVLSELEKIEGLAPENKYLPALVMREINKIEDWIFTPAFTQYGPSVSYKPQGEEWDGGKLRKKNYKTDIAYLAKFVNFLQGYQIHTKGELRDFITISLAHLSFINDNISAGKEYLRSISKTANSSIVMQKMIDDALIELKTGDVKSEDVKNKLLNCIQRLEKSAKRQHIANKNLYSLLRIISAEYEKNKDFATAGLLFLRSETNSSQFNEYESLDNYWYYWYIAYFDRYATTADIDHLLTLIAKKRKTPFEQYICSKTLGTIDMYNDLKGTIAFRNNDLEMAFTSFSAVQDSFWAKNYEFHYYLRKNPFVPVAWSWNSKQIPAYKFTKTRFIKELIELKKEELTKPKNPADLYLKLGNAYYNCSYWGNSWMMVSYGKTMNEEDYGDDYGSELDYTFGPMHDNKKRIHHGNYYHCNIAWQYYQKALETATNKEQKATAVYMLHNCEYDKYLLGKGNQYDPDNKIKFVADNYLKDFYSLYRNTKTFEDYHCPILDDFVGYKEN